MFPIFGRGRAHTPVKGRQTSRLRRAVTCPKPRFLVEALEERTVLSVSLDTISGADANGVFLVPSGKNLYVPLIGTDASDTATYTATSSNAQVTTTVLANFQVLSLTVHGTRGDGTSFSGTMTFALFDDVAPQTVQGIIDKVNAGLYNGASFYRMETASGFQLIQGGIEKTSGKSDSTILPDEFNVNATFNSSGLLAMANAGAGTATSEFFVTAPNRSLANDPQSLNFGYTIFGQILTGLDVYADVLGVSTTDSNGINYANTPVTIDSATIFTDHEHAVLRISESDDFSGSTTITVIATGSDASTAQQSFTVSAVLPSTDSSVAPPLFLAPVADATTQAGSAISFQISAVESTAGAPLFDITGTGNFTDPPPHFSVTVTPGDNNTATVTLTPDPGFTGTVTMLAHASLDSYGLHDAQSFTVTVESTVAITTTTNPISAANQHQVTVSGTGTAGDTISVTASDGTTTTAAYTATVAGDGTWTVSNIDTSTLADGTVTFTASVTNGSGESAQATAAKDTAPPVVAITSAPLVNADHETTATVSGTGEAGATIMLVATDGTTATPAYNATVAGDGTWTITGIDTSTLADGTITYTATATDAAGNSAQTSATTTKDTQAPAVEITDATNPIDLAQGNVATAHGTGEAGASISLVVSDGTHSTAALTATIAQDGTWTISGIDVSSLADGTITYTVIATDAAGNSAQSQLVASKSTVSVTLVTNPINANSAASVSISGTAQPGAAISLVATDGATTTTTYTTTVTAEGTWSIAGVDVSTLADGTIMFNVTATDDAEHSLTVSRTAVKDVVSPNVEISPLSGPVNNGNASSVTVSGTGEVGATISLVASDGTTTTAAYTTTVAADGTWTITGIDITTLADGTVSFTATATDTAGNTEQSTTTASKDTVAPAVTLVSVSDPIGIANAASVTASGTAEAGATISLVATDGTNSTGAYTTTVAEDGTWSIAGINVGSLADGTITFTATATDGGGNTATSNRSSTKTTVAVTVVTSPVNQSNVSSTSASGTGQAGASVSLVVSDGSSTTTTYTTTIAADGTWSITAIDVSSLADGTITYTVTASDGSGGTAVATKTTTKDTSPPAVDVTSVTSAIDSSNSASTSASGTAEAGAAISLVATDGTGNSTTYTTTAASDGSWSITGIDVSALADGTITYTVTATDAAGNTAKDSQSATKSSTSDASLSGFVYVDVSNSGAMPSDALVLEGVVLTLTGVDAQGNAIPSRTTTTAADGSYRFDNLAPGTYTITEAQPSKFNEGTSVVGSLSGTAGTIAVSGIVVTSGAAGTGYNFSEAGISRSVFSRALFLGRNPSIQQMFNDLVTTWGTSEPVVRSISTTESAGSNSTVAYTVTFNAAVTGVDASDFTLTGNSGANISDVSGSGTTYTVTLNNVASGLVGLNLIDDDSIVDAAGHPLGGSGTGSGNFVGSTYSHTTSESAAAASTSAASTSADDNSVDASLSSELVDSALANEDSWT